MPISHEGREVKRAEIDGVTTQTAIVAAVSGMKIVVLHYALTLDAAGEITWESASTSLAPTMELLADTPLVVGHYAGVLETASGEALNLTSTTAANGHLSYIEVRP